MTKVEVRTGGRVWGARVTEHQTEPGDWLRAEESSWNESQAMGEPKIPIAKTDGSGATDEVVSL